MELIHWTLILSMILTHCILAVVQQRTFSKIENIMLSGLPISNSRVANALQCAFLCDNYRCVGFNTEASTNDSVSVYCTPFTAHDGLVESELVSVWIDGCKVDICGMEDVDCLSSIDVDNGICLCPEGYVSGSSGCQATCSKLDCGQKSCCTDGNGNEPGICYYEEEGYFLEGDECKSCSLSITASDGATEVWQSPNYDGVDQNYPNGDYCCWLNITIPDTYTMFMVILTMDSNSMIPETNQCGGGDRFTYHSSTGSTSTYCGDLGGEVWTDTATFNTPLSFGFQFCSAVSGDGTDIGFKMNIEMKNLIG